MNFISRGPIDREIKWISKQISLGRYRWYLRTFSSTLRALIWSSASNASQTRIDDDALLLARYMSRRSVAQHHPLHSFEGAAHWAEVWLIYGLLSVCNNRRLYLPLIYPAINNWPLRSPRKPCPREIEQANSANVKFLFGFCLFLLYLRIQH